MTGELAFVEPSEVEVLSAMLLRIGRPRMNQLEIERLERAAGPIDLGTGGEPSQCCVLMSLAAFSPSRSGMRQSISTMS